MDHDVEQIYNILEEESYPVTLADLKNPTSECIVKIMLTFLSRLSIDGKTIQRATFGQEQSLSYPEAYQEVISLINLHEVMVKIGTQIFLKDLYLTDITSPGAKKSRRMIRTLLNFSLYTNNKMYELVEPLELILSRLDTLNDLNMKKNQVMDLRKEVVLENSKKTAFREKYIKQIEEAEKRVDQHEKRIEVVEKRAQIAKLTQQQAQQKNGTIKQQVVKINEKNVEMEETLVKSPEEYQTRLGNLRQDNTEKQEKLEGLIERLRDKRDLKSLFEKVQDFVTQEYQKFSKMHEPHQESKTLVQIKAEISKDLAEVKAVVKNLQDDFTNSNENSQCDAKKADEVNAQCQEHIAPLVKLHMQLLSKSQDVGMRLQEAEIRCRQSRCEKDELSSRITSLTEEIAEFLKNCQELYTNEIQEHLEIEKLWKDKYDIN